ncbi:MAG: NAD(P)-dependent alcohol dehydrogenase [Myxococcales bacterium]|nr:NAD(P)-dependent alcohol dehydrogenase [Myxococcales bacterium]
MRALHLRDSFGLDHLHLVDVPEPEPGPGEVRVRLRAASLNYRDLLMVGGLYNPRQPLPLVPLSDGVGIIDAVGPGVAGALLGERVAGCFAQGWLDGLPDRTTLGQTLGGPLPGVAQEAVVLRSNGVVSVPAHLTDVEAATLPCAALTAWTALHEHGHVQPGQTVLVQGTGGVALFALQFARQAGARVIATSGSPDKADRLRALGAAEVLDHRTEPQWGRRVREWTGGAGVDHVVEVGGGNTLAESLRAVRPGGHVALIGVLGGATADVSLLPIVMNAVRVQGVLVGHRAAFQRMMATLGLGGMRPVVDSVWPWTQARDALGHLRGAGHFGKVCLAFDGATR